MGAPFRRGCIRHRGSTRGVLMLMGGWSNWAENVVCKPKKIMAPKDEVDLAAALRCVQGPVRFVGGGMSYTPLCETGGALLDLGAFNGLTGFDGEAMVATIGAGTPLWEIASLLHRAGYGLSNMGDTDRATLGGAVGTGAHGSGWTLACMSADVASLTMVTTDGAVIRADAGENREIFAAGRLGLGLLGAVTEVGMKVRPRFKLVKTYFVHSIEETFRQLDGMAAANRHFEFFWYPYNDNIVCKSLNETTARAPEPRSAAAMRLRGERPNLKSLAVRAINEALPRAPFLLEPSHRILSVLRKSFGRVRWSNEAFPSPRFVRYLEMEYAVPYEMGPDAVREIAEHIRRKRIVTGFPLVYRIVEGDDIWLSPFYGRKCAAISVLHYVRHDTGTLFKDCEAIFRRYGGRPHWAKYHTLTAGDLAALYPKFEEFRELRKSLDPAGKLLNPYLQGLLPV